MHLIPIVLLCPSSGWYTYCSCQGLLHNIAAQSHAWLHLMLCKIWVLEQSTHLRTFDEHLRCIFLKAG